MGWAEPTGTEPTQVVTVSLRATVAMGSKYSGYIWSVSSIIGPIIQLQVQRGPLKVGKKGAQRYVTEPIAVLERLRVSPDGVVGLDGGEEILDAHHRAHSLRKNDDGVHGVSVGFTSHYRAMRQRFGGHMRVGCAGENIIVEATRRLRVDQDGQPEDEGDDVGRDPP